MNSTYVLYIVAVVAIIIVLYLVAIIIRKKNDNRLIELGKRQDLLVELPIEQSVEEIKRLELVGQSLENFEQLESRWELAQSEKLVELNQTVEKTQAYNDTFNFFKTKSGMESIEEQLTNLEDELTTLQAGLEVLKVQEEKNSARVKYALDMYEDLQQELTIKEKDLGLAYPEIIKQLTTIQTEFSEFVALNTAGDPVEASKVLERAEEYTIALGQISEKVPPFVQSIENDFPEQLEDLETGYAKLLEENYHFGDQPIESLFQIIREALTKGSEELEALELDKVETTSQDIQKRLTSLYELFENEIAAHRAVNKLVNLLPNYIGHIRSNSTLLQEAIQRLSRQYILEDKLTQAVKSLAKKLAKIEENVEPILTADELPEQAFTVLQANYQKVKTQLEEIEQEQIEVSEQLKSVELQEVQSRQLLDVYVNRLHTVKRFMEKRRLPGIPQEFLSIFFTTSSQLEALMSELSRGRIDIQAVRHLSEAVTKAMGMLEETTYQTIQDATLTEQLLQYSNRYRSFEATVQQSFDLAIQLFEVDYNYRQAFEEISYALEIIEPGVTERFVKSYEKNREVIRF